MISHGQCIRPTGLTSGRWTSGRCVCVRTPTDCHQFLPCIHSVTVHIYNVVKLLYQRRCSLADHSEVSLHTQTQPASAGVDGCFLFPYIWPGTAPSHPILPSLTPFFFRLIISCPLS